MLNEYVVYVFIVGAIFFVLYRSGNDSPSLEVLPDSAGNQKSLSLLWNEIRETIVISKSISDNIDRPASNEQFKNVVRYFF